MGDISPVVNITCFVLTANSYIPNAKVTNICMLLNFSSLTTSLF